MGKVGSTSALGWYSCHDRFARVKALSLTLGPFRSQICGCMALRVSNVLASEAKVGNRRKRRRRIPLDINSKLGHHPPRSHYALAICIGSAIVIPLAALVDSLDPADERASRVKRRF